MSQETPVAILFDLNGNPLAVAAAAAIPAGTEGLLSLGSDGTNARYMTTDTSGNQIMVGLGVAGTPAGGVVSVQGVAGGTPQPVSGTVTATQGTAAALAAAWPVEVTDGTNVLGTTAHPLVVTISTPDSDRTATGAITSTQSVSVNTQGSGSTGLQISGTWTGTISFQGSIDGTTWDAVSGVNPVTGVSQTSTTLNGYWEIASAGFQQIRALGNTVATGSATAALDASTGAQIVELGASLPTGTNSIGAVTQGAGSGAAGTYWYNRITDGTNTMPTMDVAARAGFQHITDGTNTAAVKAASTAAVATDPALVVAISPNNSITTAPQTSATATMTQPATSTTDAVILASNASRKGAVIVNTAAKTMYVALGATASATVFTYKMLAGDMIEIPFGYTGAIHGILASGTGAANVTELT